MPISMAKSRVPTSDTRRVKPPPKQTDPYYGSADHKRWAADVQQRAGGVCQDPEHEGPRLVCKGIADHIKERRDRPDLQLDPANGIYRCWPCHTRKTYAERARRMRAGA
jgi:5-methylcytosine-specific restriction protein A